MQTHPKTKIATHAILATNKDPMEDFDSIQKDLELIEMKRC